jgi:hypothetical protein
MRAGVSYLQLIRVLDEWIATPSKNFPHQRTRLALYACTYNGPGCVGETKQRPSNVTNKNVVSCGCYKRHQRKIKPPGRKNYAGKTIGRFHVLHLIGVKRTDCIWAAICLACGKQIEISSLAIGRNYSSCRCRQRRSRVRRNWERRLQERLRDAELTNLLVREISYVATSDA